MGAVVASVGGAVADRRWGVFSGQAGLLFGRWWLAAQGVEVEDELQALDFVSNT